PDEKQIAVARERLGDEIRIEQVRFEDFVAAPFDVIVLQESSQYIDPDKLFAKAAEMTRHVIVIDEFAMDPGGSLHDLDSFLATAQKHGFTKSEDVDLSRKAAPTVDYFMQRLERYRTALIADLGLTK